MVDVLNERDLLQGNLFLFPDGQSGINLIKLHGSLDVFAFREGLDLCRLRPCGTGIKNRLETLRVINTDIGLAITPAARPLNEIAALDDDGVTQFLRRSLLAGANKFDRRFHQTLPHAMLDIFRNKLKMVAKLYIIGYSFSDKHIDEIIVHWLSESHEKALIIVDPFRTSLPEKYTHLASQVQIIKSTAGEFFAQYRLKPMTRRG